MIIKRHNKGLFYDIQPNKSRFFVANTAKEADLHGKGGEIRSGMTSLVGVSSICTLAWEYGLIFEVRGAIFE